MMRSVAAISYATCCAVVAAFHRFVFNMLWGMGCLAKHPGRGALHSGEICLLAMQDGPVHAYLVGEWVSETTNLNR